MMSTHHLKSVGFVLYSASITKPRGGFASSAPYDVHAPPKKFGPYVLHPASFFTPYDVDAPLKKFALCLDPSQLTGDSL